MSNILCRQINVDIPDGGYIASIYMDTSEGELLYDPIIDNIENLSGEL